MKKMFLLSLCYLLTLSFGLEAKSIVGFWKTIDDKTHQAQSVVAVYEYQGLYYGRIIGTFDEQGNIEDSIYAPKKRAPGVKDKSYYCGMDIIWDLKKSGSKFLHGSILDPEHGKIYGAELWVKGKNLIVRGKLLFFGRNQAWLPMDDSEFNADFLKPDLNSFIPVIPQVR